MIDRQRVLEEIASEERRTESSEVVGALHNIRNAINAMEEDMPEAEQSLEEAARVAELELARMADESFTARDGCCASRLAIAVLNVGNAIRKLGERP